MENAENVVVLTTDVKNTESTKEESAEKDALLMTNVRDVAIVCHFRVFLLFL